MGEGVIATVVGVVFMEKAGDGIVGGTGVSDVVGTEVGSWVSGCDCLMFCVIVARVSIMVCCGCVQ